MRPPDAQHIPADSFASRAQSLGLKVEQAAVDGVTLRLPFDPRLVRAGGACAGRRACPPQIPRW
jgi:acyl-coenzyme A thioesterase PaaI-like protein